RAAAGAVGVGRRRGAGCAGARRETVSVATCAGARRETVSVATCAVARRDRSGAAGRGMGRDLLRLPFVAARDARREPARATRATTGQRSRGTPPRRRTAGTRSPPAPAGARHGSPRDRAAPGPTRRAPAAGTGAPPRGCAER